MGRSTLDRTDGSSDLARINTMRKYAVGAVLACVLAACGGTSTSHDVVVYRAGARAVVDHPGGTGITAAGISVPVSIDFRDLVTDVNVHPGETVHRGQLLLSLDRTPFAAQAQSLQSKQTLIQGEITNAQGRIAIAQAKGDTVQIAALNAQIVSYQGQYVILQQQIDIANGRPAQLSAPIDGAIGELKIAPGAFAAPGQILMTVIDTSHIQVTASLPIADRQFVGIGSPADISVTPSPGSTAPAQVLTGKVVQVAAGASGAGQFFQATVDAANTADHAVVPGLQAFVRVGVDHNSPVVVSKLAVLDTDSAPTVYVVDGSVVHSRTVELGISDGTYVEIVKGLSPGELCVIVGNQLLTDGTKVRVTQTVG
ncbi:MAG: efflux RND transporter periplasmic adaptor subunit [Chloroflexi bacterium]|nr:MAG: efflux RND transporter periplasmic adaptor subunit [Chloroflexota bacterium]